MTSKEWVKNELSLSDDCLTTTDRIMLSKILQDLERLEELKKAQELDICNLKFIDNENKYQVAIRVLKEAFIVLGKSDIANTCWFKYLEELEKENQELKDTNMKYAKLIDDFQTKNMRLEKALEIIKENNVDIALLKECKNKIEYNIEVQSHNENLMKPLEWWIRGKLTQQEYELLKEAFCNE